MNSGEFGGSANKAGDKNNHSPWDNFPNETKANQQGKKAEQKQSFTHSELDRIAKITGRTADDPEVIKLNLALRTQEYNKYKAMLDNAEANNTMMQQGAMEEAASAKRELEEAIYLYDEVFAKKDAATTNLNEEQKRHDMKDRANPNKHFGEGTANTSNSWVQTKLARNKTYNEQRDKVAEERDAAAERITGELDKIASEVQDTEIFKTYEMHKDDHPAESIKTRRAGFENVGKDGFYTSTKDGLKVDWKLYPREPEEIKAQDPVKSTEKPAIKIDVMEAETTSEVAEQPKDDFEAMGIEVINLPPDGDVEVASGIAGEKVDGFDEIFAELDKLKRETDQKFEELQRQIEQKFDEIKDKRFEGDPGAAPVVSRPVEKGGGEVNVDPRMIITPEERAEANANKRGELEEKINNFFEKHPRLKKFRENWKKVVVIGLVGLTVAGTAFGFGRRASKKREIVQDPTPTSVSMEGEQKEYKVNLGDEYEVELPGGADETEVETSETGETKKSEFAGELANGLKYDYTDFNSEDKYYNYNYGPTVEHLYGNEAGVKAKLLDNAEKVPEILAAYAASMSEGTKEELGIGGKNSTEIEMMFEGEGGAELAERVRNTFAEKIKEPSGEFRRESGLAKTDVLDKIVDGKVTKPGDLKAATVNFNYNNSPTYILTIDGQEYVFALGCGLQQKYVGEREETGAKEVGEEETPEKPVVEQETPPTPTPEPEPEPEPEPTPTPIPIPTPEPEPEPTPIPTPTPEPEPEPEPEPTTLTPKNVEALIRNAQSDLDAGRITPMGPGELTEQGDYVDNENVAPILTAAEEAIRAAEENRQKIAEMQERGEIPPNQEMAGDINQTDEAKAKEAAEQAAAAAQAAADQAAEVLETEAAANAGMSDEEAADWYNQTYGGGQ